MDWKEVLRRYEQVVLVICEKERWFVQQNYGQPFTCQKWLMQTETLRAMLMHKLWIACRVNPGDTIDRICIDIDCKAGDSVERRNRTYHSLRELIGYERVPLVCRTPSGRGLHVWWRIPPTRIEDLITGSRAPAAPRKAGVALRGRVFASLAHP